MLCPSMPAIFFFFFAMHLNAYNVKRHFGWMHYKSSVCYKSPLEHI